MSYTRILTTLLQSKMATEHPHHPPFADDVPIKSAGHFHSNLIEGYLKSLDCSPTPNTETGIGAMGSYPSWVFVQHQHFFMVRFPLSFRTLNRRHRWTRSWICLHAGPIQVPFSGRRVDESKMMDDPWENFTTNDWITDRVYPLVILDSYGNHGPFIDDKINIIFLA